VAIAGVHFITGFAFVVASFVMAAIERTKQLNRVLIHFYRWFPPFNFGEGLINLSKLDFEADFRGKAQNPFKWEVLGRPLLLMLLEAGFFLAVTIAIDRDVIRLVWSWLGGFWKRHVPRVPASYRHLASQIAPMVFEDAPSGRTSKPQEDADVAAERSRVESGAADDDIVLVKNLSKTYVISSQPPKLAVADLCLGIPPGQCFGFLGVNGAGKTTTLSILTGDQKPTSGTGFINGFSVLDQLPDVQRQIGYCPQFDPLLDLMTGREHLRMYARLKGVKEEGLEGSVVKLLDAVGLAKYADKVSGSYSGGNKRKLSLAIALVGEPRAIFLGE
jgi:ATP-binding cassette subfamily A (ABC1) protein 3